MALVTKHYHKLYKTVGVRENLRKPGRPPRWADELSESQDFKLLYKFDFKRPAHINILEKHTYKSLLKHLSRVEPDSRPVTLLDFTSAGRTSLGPQLDLHRTSDGPQ